MMLIICNLILRYIYTMKHGTDNVSMFNTSQENVFRYQRAIFGYLINDETLKVFKHKI